MNKIQLVLVALMVAVITNISYAQPFFPALENRSAAEKEQMDKRLAISLSSTNNGVVESALAVTAMIKLDLPLDEFPMVRDRIAYLAAHSSKPMIRYRACLVEAVLTNPEMFRDVVGYQYTNPSTLFGALAGKTTKTLLSSD